MYIQVNVSDEMVSKVDKHAKSIGISRSALCALFIGQGINGMESANSIIDDIKDCVKVELSNSLSDKSSSSKRSKKIAPV